LDIIERDFTEPTETGIKRGYWRIIDSRFGETVMKNRNGLEIGYSYFYDDMFQELYSLVEERKDLEKRIIARKRKARK
jgi:hypothetical protein